MRYARTESEATWRTSLGARRAAQPVEEEPSGSGGSPVEPEGEFVEIVGQVLPADPMVQSAGCPSFEQRGDQVGSGHDRVEIIGEIARSRAMSETVVAES